MAEDLVHLAETFLRLSGELNETREAMKRLLLNGGEGTPAGPFSRPARVSGVQRPNLGAAQAAEARILELLRERPQLKTGAIAQATGSNTQTVSDRLKRLRKRGEIIGGGAGGWVAASV
jgi:hypothetical protein